MAHNTFQLIQNYPNFTEPDEQILQTTRDSAQKLVNIVNTLSNLQDTSTSTAGVVDDILLVVQELLVLHNDSTALYPIVKRWSRNSPTIHQVYIYWQTLVLLILLRRKATAVKLLWPEVAIFLIQTSQLMFFYYYRQWYSMFTKVKGNSS